MGFQATEAVIGATCALVYSVLVHEWTHYFIGTKLYKNKGRLVYKSLRTVQYRYRPKTRQQDIDVTLGGIMAGLLFLVAYALFLPLTWVYVPLYLFACRSDILVLWGYARGKKKTP